MVKKNDSENVIIKWFLMRKWVIYSIIISEPRVAETMIENMIYKESKWTNLYSIFRQISFEWQHFSSVNIRIMCFFKRLLQLFQLIAGKDCPIIIINEQKWNNELLGENLKFVEIFSSNGHQYWLMIKQKRIIWIDCENDNDNNDDCHNTYISTILSSKVKYIRQQTRYPLISLASMQTN